MQIKTRSVLGLQTLIKQVKIHFFLIFSSIIDEFHTIEFQSPRAF